jgi:hypothetical protein
MQREASAAEPATAGVDKTEAIINADIPNAVASCNICYFSTS